MALLLFFLTFLHLVQDCTNVLMLERAQKYENNTTLSNGYLGSRNDEERSEMRYVMRIAELSESSNL